MSYQEFISDVGRRPSQKHSIDRINNDGNYSCGKCKECISNEWPMNCRWATREEQNNNRTRASDLENHSTQNLIGELRKRGLPVDRLFDATD